MILTAQKPKTMLLWFFPHPFQQNVICLPPLNLYILCSYKQANPLSLILLGAHKYIFRKSKNNIQKCSREMFVLDVCLCEILTKIEALWCTSQCLFRFRYRVSLVQVLFRAKDFPCACDIRLQGWQVAVIWF